MKKHRDMDTGGYKPLLRPAQEPARKARKSHMEPGVSAKERAIRNHRVLDGFKALGCEECEETDVRCMEIHHLKPRLGRVVAWPLLSQEELDKELLGCVVLCANCHRKAHSS